MESTLNNFFQGCFSQKYNISLSFCLFILAIFLLYPCVLLFSGDDILPMAAQSRYSLSGKLEYLVDHDRELTIDNVAQAASNPDFQRSAEEILNFGYTGAAVWVRLTLQDLSTKGDWVLKIDALDDVRLYFPGDGGVFTEKRIGRKLPSADTIRRYGYFLVSLEEFKKAGQVYIRFVHEDTMIIHLSIMDMKTYLETDIDDLIYGAYFGIIAVMVLYNLLLFLLLRDSSYVYYAFYIFNMFLMQVIFSGIILDFIPQGSFIAADMVETVVISLALASYIMFVRKFLLTGLLSLRVDKMLVFMVFVALAHIPTIFFVPFLVRTLFLSVAFAATVALNTYVAILCIRRGYTPVRFYIIAFLIVAAGVTLFVLRNMGILPNVFITEFGMIVASSIEAVLFAFGLAFRINMLQKEKELAQEWSRYNLRKARQLESDYQMLFQTAPLGIALFDREGRYLEVNDAYCRMYGADRDELSGKIFYEIVYQEERRPAEKTAWGNFIASALGGIATFEKTNIRKSGQRINVRYFISLTQPQEGVPGGVLCCVEDTTDLKRALDDLRSSVREKELLLKEVHHRVKNNLQIILSLFRIKSREISDPKINAILESTARKVRAIANLHNRIYLSKDVAHVESETFIHSSVKQSLAAFHLDEEKLEMVYAIQSVRLSVDIALPLSLIIGELVANSVMHGYNERDRLTLTVAFKKLLPADQTRRAIYLLRIEDDGRGFPEGFCLEKVETFGLTLVTTLVSQIEGTMALVTRPRTEFSIQFPWKD